MITMESKPFGLDAQARIAALFRTCSPESFLTELGNYAPATSSERVAYHKYQGWALYDSGHYARSRLHLLTALRSSVRDSADRSLIRGLLGESYLRLGHFKRAERCVRRALSHECPADAEHDLRAGHLQMLARVQSLLGHLTHALETYFRGLAHVAPGSARSVPLMVGVIHVHLKLGQWLEADRYVRELRDSPLPHTGRQQWWFVATVECPLAVALGDVERADRVVREAMEFYPQAGERIQFIVTELEASVLQARGRYEQAEHLLRGILSRSVLGGPNSDAVASASRALTESLMSQGRNAEALEWSRLAVRAGSVDDRSEWVTALRLMGECWSALGSTQDARRAFREAISVHASTQFTAEQELLDRTLQRLGFEDLLAGEEANPRRPTALRGRAEVNRLSLRSGRVFLSHDRQLIEAIRSAAVTDLPVLIEGETGTGKELVAQLVHELGPRAKGQLVVVDCTSLPESLADVELFGATRGAYTGSFQDRAGLLAQADGGTLLLDELPELSTALQAKLLRVVQEGAYRRVGEDRLRRVDVRFVATTNLSIQILLDTGVLKPDLFYRLSGHRLTLRPLRARREDIEPLADEIAKRSGLAGIDADAVRLLASQMWPGNVRQLEMVLRLTAASCKPGTFLDCDRLLPHLEGASERGPGAIAGPAVKDRSLRASRFAAERAVLEQALARNDGVVARAAREVGISRQSFYKAMRRAGIAHPRTDPSA